MTVIAVPSTTIGQFSPMDVGGSEYFFWDFTAWLPAGVTAVSAVVTAKNTADGSDNSASMVSGSATIVNGTVACQMILSGVLGDTYALAAKVTTSDTPPQLLVLTCNLTIGPVSGIPT